MNNENINILTTIIGTALLSLVLIGIIILYFLHAN
jgi:hypothetical protein